MEITAAGCFFVSPAVFSAAITGSTRFNSSSAVTAVLELAELLGFLLATLDDDVAGAWTRRFATDVENVGAFFLQALSMCDGLVAVEVRPAVGKGIGRDIDDPHDQRALA